jgi:predicted extracellular nuclease
MLTIATFNLRNLSATAPPTRLARLGKIVVDVLETPDILAVQEIAADRSTVTGPVLADTTYQALITAIGHAGGPDYDFREIPPLAHQDGGMAGANIRVGLLFNPAKVSFSDRGPAGPEDRVGILFSAGQPGLTFNPGRIDPLHPAFTGDECRHWAPSRKPLVAELAWEGRRLFVLVCHFKSMRSPIRREADYAKKQRHAQAEIVYGFAADLLDCDPQAAIVLLGDLNDVPGSKTLKLLKGGRFHNLLDDVPHQYCYTRRHGHEPQALDHILVSPALRRGATLRIPHLHSDPTPGGPEPASDHDPVVAVLEAA